MMISRAAANPACLSGVRDWLSVKVHDAISGLLVEQVGFDTSGVQSAAPWTEKRCAQATRAPVTVVYRFH
jgi:hypothetical protein